MDKMKLRITEIPVSELKKNMAAYGRKQAASVRSSRKYLRSLGMPIKPNGTISC